MGTQLSLRASPPSGGRHSTWTAVTDFRPMVWSAVERGRAPGREHLTQGNERALRWDASPGPAAMKKADTQANRVRTRTTQETQSKQRPPGSPGEEEGTVSPAG